MNEKIRKIAEEVYKVGHRPGGCEDCPLNRNEMCDRIDCYKGTVEEIATEIEEEYTRYKNLVGTIENYEGSVLDEVEKEYLTNIIKPFVRKEYDVKVKKVLSFDDEEEYICISVVKFGCEEKIEFPYFSKNAMYKNMEPNKWYTLKELGLKF